MTSKIKVNILADGGDNSIITSDGAGSFTASSSLASSVQSVGGIQNTPAFSARMSGIQSITHEVYTKVDFDTEIFDTDGAYDPSTNQRFTVPSGKDGKYFFYANLIADSQSAANLQNCQITFYKNGSEFKKNTWNFNSNDIFYAGMQISSVMDLSAADYIEVYVRISDASGSPRIDGSGSTLSEFTGYKIIGV